jgi:hypothetical protein
MNQVIIYKQDTGVVAIVRPTEEALALYGIEAIAQKDVPAGKPYKIIDSSEIPTDRSQRNAWTVDEADLTDGVGAEFSTFDEVQP